MVAVSKEDLRFLIEQAMAHATEQALAAAALRSINGFKVMDPPPFSGRPEDLEDFLTSCEMMFAIKPDDYGTSD